MKYTLVNDIKISSIAIPEIKSNKMAICAGGFIVKKDKFLLGKRSKKKDWAPGLWDIMGGHSLQDEHPLLTLQRETLEETGLQVLNAVLLTSGNIQSVDSAEVLFRYHIFMITHYKGKPLNRSKEHTRLEWFTRKELDELPLALEEYRMLIDAWLKK